MLRVKETRSFKLQTADATQSQDLTYIFTSNLLVNMNIKSYESPTPGTLAQQSCLKNVHVLLDLCYKMLDEGKMKGPSISL